MVVQEQSSNTFLKAFRVFSFLSQAPISLIRLWESQKLLKYLWKSDISKLQENEIEVSDVT